MLKVIKPFFCHDKSIKVKSLSFGCKWDIDLLFVFGRSVLLTHKNENKMNNHKLKQTLKAVCDFESIFTALFKNMLMRPCFALTWVPIVDLNDFKNA